MELVRVVDAEIVHLIGDTWIPRDHEQVSILGPAGWAQVEHAVTSLASAARPSHPVPMADARLQQLRRAWDEGDLETQVRLLRERMRAGELSEERVQLAARLGHVATCQLTQTDAEGLTAVLEAVAAVPGAPLRAAISTLRFAQGGALRQFAGRVAAQVRLASQGTLLVLEATESLACSTLRESEQRLRVAYQGFLPHARIGLPHFGAGMGPWEELAACVSIVLDRLEPDWLVVVAKGSHNEAETLRALQEDLVPWALGLRDPVAERVAAREAAK